MCRSCLVCHLEINIEQFRVTPIWLEMTNWYWFHLLSQIPVDRRQVTGLVYNTRGVGGQPAPRRGKHGAFYPVSNTPPPLIDIQLYCVEIRDLIQPTDLTLLVAT